MTHLIITGAIPAVLMANLVAGESAPPPPPATAPAAQPAAPTVLDPSPRDVARARAAALAAAAADAERLGLDPIRMIDAMVLRQMPERVFANGVWVRRPPVIFVRTSQTLASANEPLVAPQAAVLPEPPAAGLAVTPPTLPPPSTAPPAAVAPPILVTSAAPAAPPQPLAAPAAADLVEPPKPLPEPAPEPTAVQPVAVPSPAPAAPVPVAPPRPVATPGSPARAVPPPAPVPAVETTPAIQVWARRSVDDVATACADGMRNQAWVGQARARLGRLPRIQVGAIADRSSGGVLGIDRLVQALGLSLQQVRTVDAAPGNPPDYQLVGLAALSADSRFVQVDLHFIDVATQQTLQPFSLEVPATPATPSTTRSGTYVP